MKIKVRYIPSVITTKRTITINFGLFGLTTFLEWE